MTRATGSSEFPPKYKLSYLITYVLFPYDVKCHAHI